MLHPLMLLDGRIPSILIYFIHDLDNRKDTLATTNSSNVLEASQILLFALCTSVLFGLSSTSIPVPYNHSINSDETAHVDGDLRVKECYKRTTYYILPGIHGHIRGTVENHLVLCDKRVGGDVIDTFKTTLFSTKE